MSNVNDFKSKVETVLYNRVFDSLENHMDGKPVLEVSEQIIKESELELITKSTVMKSDTELSAEWLGNTLGTAVTDEIIKLKHDGDYLVYYFNVDEVNVTTSLSGGTTYALQFSFIVLPKDSIKVVATEYEVTVNK